MPGCPNAEPPKALFQCDICETPIYDGERHWNFNGEHFHEECFNDCAVQILEGLGAKREERLFDEIQ